jgi:hypothetical protein
MVVVDPACDGTHRVRFVVADKIGALFHWWPPLDRIA